jgi:hypothetical protein
VKKSVPASSARWIRMKAGQVVVRLRSGAGAERGVAGHCRPVWSKKLKTVEKWELSLPAYPCRAASGTFLGVAPSRIGWHELGAHPGLRHGDGGPGAAAAERISGCRKPDPEGQVDGAGEVLGRRASQVRHFIEGSLALASLNLACRNLVPAFPPRSPPSLLTTVACGGLRPEPDCRPRRVLLHLVQFCAAVLARRVRDTRPLADVRSRGQRNIGSHALLASVLQAGRKSVNI